MHLHLLYVYTTRHTHHTYLVRGRVGRLVEVDHAVPNVLLQLALQRGAPARDGGVPRRSALQLVVVPQQQRPLGRLQGRLLALRPHHVLRCRLRSRAAILVTPLRLLALLLLDVA